MWEDHLVDLRRQKRNASVYDAIVEALRQAGFVRTRLQVQHKIENLSQTYRFWLKNQKTGAGAIPWVHFWRIHSFLGTLPANDPSRAQESQVTVEEVIMGMVTGDDSAAAGDQDGLQEGESTLSRPTDVPSLDSVPSCSPASSSQDSPSASSSSAASPSNPSTSNGSPAANTPKGQRPLKEGCRGH
ncbi:hypothetical protein HPB52_004391 [Rhipicephalus sanguineus]|uniref:Myb/SANT-like DNA-binding domain-containing protein n=1 Tax=Rhipicephalus sanguineus TaxID=34632 RepID=A0A9D4T1E5_RHISA|nr:hypothetical protein HPB52_004391 [Rhipicephalus sanguineus]